jgi:TRAP-type mannitol/chloroaromatic compound transport system substrate-binding protein
MFERGNENTAYSLQKKGRIQLIFVVSTDRISGPECKLDPTLFSKLWQVTLTPLLVPAMEITESVKEGKIEAGYQWVGHDQGRIPASTLIAAVPFGMEPMEFLAWWYYGGGQALGEALYQPHNVMPILCGITSPETAGWFREPVESLDDLVGVKIRFAGLGGRVLQQPGASVTMIPAGETFQALEKGAIA